MSSPITNNEGTSLTGRPRNFKDVTQSYNQNWKRPPHNGWKDQRNGKPNWKGNDRSFMGKGRFNNLPHRAHKKKGKEKKSQNKVQVLKKKEEYSHLVNSNKLTVFDWDRTIMLRNLPAQIDAVKKLVQKEIKDTAIEKFCPIKKTFKSNALVTLACVLKNQADVVKAVAQLSNLKVGDYQVIVSRFVKPHSFISNAFSACIVNFPSDASEKQLSEILEDCGVISSLDVEYSESGAVKKVLVNLSDASHLATLLQKNGALVKPASFEILPIKPSNSVIVGNVHAKVSRDKLAKIFEDDVLLVQKMSHMIFQIFFKDEESAERALRKDGESIKNLSISVRPWSKKNSKQHKVFVHLAGNESEGGGTFDVSEFFHECGNPLSITPIKKNASFFVIFESKEAKKAALLLHGTIFNGRTVEVTKKLATKKSEPNPADQNSASNTTNSSSKKNHVYFE